MDRAIVTITASDTHHLRRLVLRDGTASDNVVFDGDELDSTFHLGLKLELKSGARLIAISTWVERHYPDRPDVPGYQLRGMATEPECRRTGAGQLLLEAGAERCRAAGAGLVWARARDTAVGFYEQHGFTTSGLGYLDLTTGLPHHDMIRIL